MGCRTSPTNGEGGRIRQRVSAKSDGLGKARGSIPPCGCICMHRKRINLSTVLAGQRVGIKEVDEGIWIVSASCTTILATSTWNRSPCNLWTTRSARGCYLCLRYAPLPMSSDNTRVVGRRWGIRTPDQRIKSPLLYQAELTARARNFGL